jgi:hypothetical protein
VPAPCPRTKGTQAANFALLPPDWSGTVPAEFTSIGALKRLPRRAEADGTEDTHLTRREPAGSMNTETMGMYGIYGVAAA